MLTFSGGIASSQRVNNLYMTVSWQLHQPVTRYRYVLDFMSVCLCVGGVCVDYHTT